MLRLNMDKKPASVRMLESLFECEQPYVESAWRRDEIKRAASRVVRKVAKQPVSKQSTQQEVNELRQ